MGKRLLIDIGHPAHVHYFKNAAKKLIDKGYDVLFTTRDKEMAIYLLDIYGFRYVNLGKPFKTKIGKVFGLFYFTFRLLVAALRFKPDFYLNATFYSAFVAKLMQKPHISIEDTFNKESVRLFMPFTDYVLTGDYDHPSLGEKEIRIAAYQELLYLHPNTFFPDIKVLDQLNIKEGEKYVIIRFVSWNASHDFGHKGISCANKILAVNSMSGFAKVFITSEGPLPEELNKYRFPLAPEKMHDALFFADLVYGESATMVSEGAVLGIPGIYLDDTGRYYTKDQEIKYGLVYNFTESETDQKESINKAIELLLNKNAKSEWEKKRMDMLSEKIDPTSFLVWFIEKYPLSVKMIQDDPLYQYSFK